MRRVAQIDHSPTAKHRKKRFKIALALEGHGCAEGKAREWNVRLETLYHVAAGRRSWRIESLMDAYIRETFAKHRDVLDLDAI